MIYKFSLQNQKQGQTPKSRIPGHSLNDPGADRKITASLPRYGNHPFIDNQGYSGYKNLGIIGSPNMGFCALRMSNRQIAFETEELLYIPGIALTMGDDLAITLAGNRDMLDFLRQDWVRDNLTSVQIQFLWDGNPGFAYKGDQLVKMYPSTTIILLRRLCWALGLARGHWKEDWEFDFRPRGNLSAIAGILNECQKLNKFELWAESEAFFELWDRPVGDMMALGPLAKKGVEVVLMTQDGISSHLGHWRAFERMKSRWGVWAWFRLKVIGRGLRWGKPTTVYARDEAHGGDCMKYCVLTSGGN